MDVPEKALAPQLWPQPLGSKAHLNCVIRILSETYLSKYRLIQTSQSKVRLRVTPPGCFNRWMAAVPIFDGEETGGASVVALDGSGVLYWGRQRVAQQ
eukprot:scaffold479862_cov15-Prasinocladus_malaysianus.AAC.1